VGDANEIARAVAAFVGSVNGGLVATPSAMTVHHDLIIELAEKAESNKITRACGGHCAGASEFPRRATIRIGSPLRDTPVVLVCADEIALLFAAVHESAFGRFCRRSPDGLRELESPRLAKALSAHLLAR